MEDEKGFKHTAFKIFLLSVFDVKNTPLGLLYNSTAATLHICCYWVKSWGWAQTEGSGWEEATGLGCLVYRLAIGLGCNV